jgi:hypothetical protein
VALCENKKHSESVTICPISGNLCADVLIRVLCVLLSLCENEKDSESVKSVAK